MSTSAQQQLALVLTRIKQLIQQKLDGAQEVRSPMAEPCEELDRITAQFGLTPFERDLLAWCAGVELDSGLADLTASLPGQDGRRCPSFSLALAALPDAHWSALVPTAPLRYWRMLEPGTSSLTRAELRIDERILHQLAGVPFMDLRLSSMLRPTAHDQVLTQRQQALVSDICEAWSAQAGRSPVLQVIGKDRDTSCAIACAVARRSGSAAYRIDARHLPARTDDLEGFVRLWQRECILGRNMLLVDRHGLGAQEEGSKQALAFCDDVEMPVFVLGSERLHGLRRTVLTFEAPTADRSEQIVLWRSALGEHAVPLNGALDRMVDQFDLNWTEISNAALQSSSDKITEQTLRQASRVQARPKLDGLAKRITSRAGWDDLVLAEKEKSTLRDIALHLAHRGTVHERWGFGQNNGRGAAITALFSGPSGTGKTLAAEILARELDLDLYKIDLSQVVSKYIGESEKNLARIFDAAESGGAILLFDEADALFGKRSEVKDSHDRYANIEVSYLLQRMEEYRGLAILTTNMKQALDNAFMRRLTFVVDFRFPDQAQRAAIWSRMFPSECPQEGIDHAKLAQLNISGGNIRSIALAAAHYAAADGGALGMPHLLRATRSEYDKLDKALSTAEIKGWT